MINYIWAFMIIFGIIFSLFSGSTPSLGVAAINSSKEAVALCVTMLGVMALWTGLINVAKNAGIIDKLTKWLYPIIHFLFPGIPKGHVACEYIASNMIANLLGLGWAATPMGLKAMQELSKLNSSSHYASRDMCTFLIINISSLQLIPVNIIAYRSEYGSQNPASILGAAIVATIISTLVAVIFCRLMNRITKH